MSSPCILMRRFSRAHPTAWRNANIVQNRYVHLFRKEKNGKVSQSADAKGNPNLDPNLRDNGTNEFEMKSNAGFRVESQMFFTEAVKNRKPPQSPPPPPPDKGSGPKHG